MKEIAPIPFALRYAKMPRGESWVDPARMSPENQLIWEQRCRERAESLREVLAELGADVPEPLPDQHRRANLRRTPTGAKTAAVLAAMRDGRPWTPQQLAEATGFGLCSIYNALHNLNDRGEIIRVRCRGTVGTRNSSWRAVEGGR